MSNEITAYKIYSSGVILRGVKRLEGSDKDSLVQLLFDIAAQVAEREQSPAVDHAALVAKLRELPVFPVRMLTMQSDYIDDSMIRLVDLNEILSTEPADPVDAAIRSANGAEGVE